MLCSCAPGGLDRLPNSVLQWISRKLGIRLSHKHVPPSRMLMYKLDQVMQQQTANS